MASRTETLLRINCFQVLIGDRELGIAEVSRISSQTDLDGPPGRPIHRFPTVVLRRALTDSTELYDWRRAIVAGKDDRRDVTIRQLATPGGTIVNAWKLVRAWPSRWSGPAFDAMRHDIAWEELELSFDDLVWLAPDRPEPVRPEPVRPEPVRPERPPRPERPQRRQRR